MLNYVIKRLLGLIPTLLIVAVLVFLFVHMLPGDPARLIAGPEADAQVVAMVRQQLGLDQPLHVQFWHYITNVLRGDFGISMASRRPVASEIASRFMPTLWLTLASMSWAVLFGMAAGIAAAVWRNRWPDRLGMALAVSGISFPAFALGMALLCLVAMVWYNLLLALIFAAMMLGGYLWFRKTAAARERAPVDPQLRTVS